MYHFKLKRKTSVSVGDERLLYYYKEKEYNKKKLRSPQLKKTIMNLDRINYC